MCESLCWDEYRLLGENEDFTCLFCPCCEDVLIRAYIRAAEATGQLTVNLDPSNLLLASLLIFKRIQAKWLYLCYILLFICL